MQVLRRALRHIQKQTNQMRILRLQVLQELQQQTASVLEGPGRLQRQPEARLHLQGVRPPHHAETQLRQPEEHHCRQE